jgi:hypothetical protein
MAKHKEDRYSSVEELLTDLEAVRNGQPPLRARTSFDISELEQLEEGEAIDVREKVYKQETVARYQIVILILSAVAAISLLGVVLLIFNLLKSAR